MQSILQDILQKSSCNKAAYAKKKSSYKPVQICKKTSFAFPGKGDQVREKRVYFSITQIEN